VSGGGGGGGVLTGSTTVTTSGSPYTITVGSGGAGDGVNGQNSVFNSLTAIGGGGGGLSTTGVASSGGSGGGSSASPGAVSASGTAGQGYSGGVGSHSGNPYAGGGGGGAGAAGANGGGNYAGNGGAGVSSSITGSAVTYGGGGGGGGVGPNGAVAGSGGAGGGANGDVATGGTPHNATANTGGGGGGAGGSPVTGAGGSGGSGIVILSYPTSDASNYTCGGTTTTSGSNTICTYTSSGTFTVSSTSGTTTVTTSTPGYYLPRIDDGSFRQYTFASSTNSWTMFDKKGNEYFFGSTTQSQQSATSTPSQVYKWMLERVQDPNGNYVRYAYAKDGNQIYPSEIVYTGHDSTDGPMTVTFATSTRPDAVPSYASGFRVDTNWRISQITAAVSGTTVRQYNLGYAVGNNGTRSMLASVQKNGWDSSSVEASEPAMTFSYMNVTTPFLEQGGNGSSNFAGSCNGDPWVVTDVNGEGVNDMTTIQLNNAGGTTVGWVNGTALSNPPPTGTYWANESNTCLREEGSRLLDVSGNGKADIVQSHYPASGGTLYLNTTSGGSYSWTATTSFNGTIPVIAVDNGSVPVTTGFFGNLNGTGLPSYEIALPSSSGHSSWNGAYFGNGSAWNSVASSIFTPPMYVPYGSSDCTNSQLVDMNGDGLDDWVYTDGTKTYTLLNNGRGWNSTPDPRWTVATSTVYSSGGQCRDRGMRFADLSGDGLPDFIRSYTASSTGLLPELGTDRFVYLNTGNGWATSTAYSLPYIIDGTNHTGTAYSELFNFNGNGQQSQDVLSTITYPKGGSTSVTYEYTTKSGPNTSLPYSLLVATKVVNHDGRGSNEETDYAYRGGLQYLPTNVFDRKFAGFGSVTASTSQSKVVTYYSQGATSTALVTGDQSDGYGQLNHPYRKDTLTPAGTLKQSIFYRYDPILHGSSAFVSLSRQLQQEYAADGSHIDRATDYTYSTTTDDLLKSINYGQVSGNSDGTFSTTTASVPRTTSYTYARNSAINLSVPIEKTLFNNLGATTTDSKYFYDSLSFGSVNLGNLTQKNDWVSGSHFASSTKAYNSYGLVATSTDPDGNAVTYSYDSYNLYPATTTNALAQSTAYTYDYSNGKVKRTSSPNGGITLNSYDGLGRLTGTDASDPANPSSLVAKLAISYTDSTSTPSLIHETGYLNAATTTETYGYYDGLSRLIQERKSTETAGTYTVADRSYDVVGNLASKSFPYFSSGSTNTAATTTASLYTTYTYDLFGRAATSTNAVGSTANVYSKWTTTTTDPNGNSKDYILDAFGNLAQVVEHGTSNATTTYAYDAANNLATTTDALGNIRTFTYDGLGRRVSATDLHTSGVGAYGNWSYSYDDAGNEVSRTDPNSNVITHTYDALNRMLTEGLTGQGTKVTNTYDTCPSGIGQLCTASSTSAFASYVYDVLGRTSIATTTIAGTDYPLSYSYDRQGNVTNMTIPDGSVFNYTYNGAGLISAVSRTATTSTSLIASMSNFAPTSAIGKVLFGSQASTTYTYNPAALYRLTEIKTLGTGTATSSSGTASSTGTFLMNYLVVGGGGGGGDVYNWGAGGGGGGGVLTGTTTAVAGTYTITVGSGGSNNADGSNSSALGLTALGGGAGGSSGSGYSGGNGGGGSGATVGGYGGSGATGQGYNGGDGNWGGGSYHAGGGGGGAGAGGGNPPNVMIGGAGGTGIASSISGTLAYYAGGGGGQSPIYDGPGGTGGGGTGRGYIGNGGDGTANTGGGGGGANNLGSSIHGGYGGSGIVIISYPTADASNYTCAGTATTTGSNTVCTYTSSGTFTVAASSAGVTTTASSTPWTFSDAGTLQDLNFTYDANGNMLTRVDNSDAGLGQGVTYSYDSLNRLMSTTATGGYAPYSQSFTYDALGNILTGSAGTYTYGGTNNANPDAATQLVLTTGRTAPTIAYDNSAIAGNGIPASSLTFSYTDNSNTNGLIVVSVSEATSSPCTSDTVTGVTDNGDALTDLGYYTRNTNIGALKTYYGFVPAQGTRNIIVSASAACILYATAATYTGVKQSSMPNASGTGNPLNDSGSMNPFQVTTPISGVNAWNVLVGVPSKTGTATAGLGTTLRQQQSGSLYYADSNGPVSGDSVLSLSMPSSTNWLANYFSLSPLTSNPGITSTTTYAYDYNGNLTQTITGATTTTYGYDYNNRLVALGVNGATTTYAYDAFGSRVLQGNGLATTTYPSKFYSIISSMNGATTTATSTEYAYDGNMLLATIDTLSTTVGATTTTATSTIHYVHPDNLGSTQATSDANGNLSQFLDYAPYGSVLASTNSGQGNISKGFIGQYSDQSGLSYLNARYYNPAQGQFLSQDPVFLSNPKQQNLQDPQSLNAYSYSEDNPITKSDPSGKCLEDGCVVESLAAIGGTIGVGGRYIGDVMENRANGITGLQALEPRSSLAQYIAAGGTGAASLVASTYSLGLGAVLNAGGYALDNQLAGNQFSPLNTLAVGGLSFLGGNFVEWGVGEVPMSLFLKKAFTGGIFDMSSQAILQNSLGNNSSINTANTTSNSTNHNFSVQVSGYSLSPSSLTSNQFSSLAGFASSFNSSSLTSSQRQSVQGVINSFTK
jgi:RHS repeat-associated protein